MVRHSVDRDISVRRVAEIPKAKLVEIAEQHAWGTKKYTFEAGLDVKLLRFIEKRYGREIHQAGNARLAMNLVEDAHRRSRAPAASLLIGLAARSTSKMCDPARSN